MAATPPQRVASEAEVAAVVGRYEAWKRAVGVLYVLASALPIYACAPIVRTLAGKQTSVSFTYSISITITISIVLSATVVTLLLKQRAQRQQLRECRNRVQELEAQLASRAG